MKQTVFKYKGEEIVKLSNTEWKTLGHTYSSVFAAQMYIDRIKKPNWRALTALEAQFSMN